jgi:hypothetical protein
LPKEGGAEGLANADARHLPRPTPPVIHPSTAIRFALPSDSLLTSMAT